MSEFSRTGGRLVEKLGRPFHRATCKRVSMRLVTTCKRFRSSEGNGRSGAAAGARAGL